AKAEKSTQKEAQEISLLDAVRQQLVTVEAEGTGDGRMTLNVTNQSSRRLNVVLPPGLIASGATGQFGGMGGMGGGMGGMGGNGGGMGGMGGGMMGGGMGGMGGGMMGGGMGGMGGGMGGMGGGMGGGGMMGGGTMPATMGMMMLGRLIMSLIGDRDSWDQRSLMSGMMGGMGMMGGGMGGGMGGMGGGMGGMGGGMGGMGGGFRSVPPTDLPFANLQPGQTRHLPTRLVSLSNPNADPEHAVNLPEKGEKLAIGDIGQLTDDVQVQKALTRLAKDKAPITVSQLVMWRLVSQLEWSQIASLSKKFANSHELALARHFVAQLNDLPAGETGNLVYEVTASAGSDKALAAEIGGVLKEKSVLGLKTKAGVGPQPDGPSVACRIQVTGAGEKAEALIQVFTTDGNAANWVPAGKFTLPVSQEAGKVKAEEFADTLAEGVLGRLVRAQLTKGPKDSKGHLTYKIRIDNASPLILNGLAILGEGAKEKEIPKVLAGICVSPRKSMTVPATGEMVEKLGLKKDKDIRVIAADLSGL
ncbi:MAG: hypothetical protein P4L84_22525, partial [Isosphaeraceae bacterium]|nr:hypothetical protein [Isosphaeraceae bacterium]